MSNILIIGANGFIGQEVRKLLLEESQHQITLFSRTADQIKLANPNRERAIAGDILHKWELDDAMVGQDIVIWAASGDIETLTLAVVENMITNNVRRLIHMNAMGIYNEVPDAIGKQFNLDNWPVITQSRRAADIITEAPLNYTIIRGAWFDDRGDRNYTLSDEGHPFGGRTVSRTSIADFILKLVTQPDLYARTSVGIHRPTPEKRILK